MSTKPLELTEEDKSEIASMEAVREMWGAKNDPEFLALFEGSIYAVKYEYVSGGPGYAGDLIVLTGDGDYSEHVTLIRKNRNLRVV